MPVKILYREKNLMRFYHKEKIDNKRNIYLLGHKVFSYTKSSNVGITPIYDDENAIFRTSFWNKEQEALVNLAKNKDYSALITHLFNQDSEFDANTGGGDSLYFDEYFENRVGMQMIYDEIVQNHTDKEILDLGCGNCALLDKLSQANLKVKGIDASAFRVLNHQKNHNFVYFALAEHIPLDDESIDIVISQEVLEHVFDIEQTLSEMHRILRKNGICFIQVPYKNLCESVNHLRLFSKESLSNLVAKRFEILSCELVPYLLGEKNNNIYLKAKKVE